MTEYLKEIIDKYGIVKQKKLLKGWSLDRKYILESENADKYLLRLTDKEFYEKRYKQYQMLENISKSKIHSTKAIDFGILDDGVVYMLMTYLDGKEGLEVLGQYSNEDAYILGMKAGEILKTIHTIPFEERGESWWDMYQKKYPRKIYNIENCGERIPQQDIILKYYRNNIQIMKDRPLVFCHGDFHLGNMIINNDELGIIDFEKATIGDPYDDLKPFRWNVLVSEYFQTGLVNAYFENNIPEDFWPILKFYAVESMISQLPWAQKYGKEEVDTAYMLVDKQLEWYDNLKLTIPTWYKGIIG